MLDVIGLAGSLGGSLEASDEALVSGRERLKLAKGRDETGLGNAIELSGAQLALSNDQAQEVRTGFRKHKRGFDPWSSMTTWPAASVKCGQQPSATPSQFGGIAGRSSGACVRS